MENVLVHLDENGLAVKDMELDIVGVHLVASRKFFKSFDVGTSTDILFTSSLFQIIDKRFKSVEEITVKVDDKKIYVESVGKGPKYDEDLIMIKKKPWTLKMSSTPEYGVIPSAAVGAAKVIAKVVIGSMMNLPDSKVYTFISEAGKEGESPLKLLAKDIGSFYMPVEVVGEVPKREDLRVDFNTNYFDRLVSNLSEQAFILVNQDTIVMVKTTDDLATTLLLTAQEPDT